MTDHPEGARRGSIDAHGDIAALDLVAFNGGVNPFGNPFMDEGFSLGAAHYRAILDRWKMRDFATVADLGSGYGRWSLFLGEVNETVTGFERNAEAVALSRRLAAHFGLSGVQFETADITRIAVPDASFDAAWCYNVLHLADRGRLLREAARILVPGGTLLIGWYNGAGRVLEKLLQSYAAGGMTHRVTQFALRVLRADPLSDTGMTYGAPEHIAAVVGRHGFDLDAARPIEVEWSGSGNDALRPLIADLPVFADRFEQDAAFAKHVAAMPEIARLHPANLHFGATKR